MSHYPSTAELASFRRAIHDANIAAVERITGRPTMTFVHPSASPAFPSERRNGIGYSCGSPTAPFLVHEADGGPFPMGYAVSCAWADAYDHSWARKAAGAMRSRAFGTMSDDPWLTCDVCGSEEWSGSDDPWLTCDVCGSEEWSGDLPADWNGETGAHLSCESGNIKVASVWRGEAFAI